MNNMHMRYLVEEIAYFSRMYFVVQDTKENNREICGCDLRKDAGMIAGLLNNEEEP